MPLDPYIRTPCGWSQKTISTQIFRFRMSVLRFLIDYHRFTAARLKRHTCTTPPGLTPIMMQIPRNAESFSSLSRMFLSEVHLDGSTRRQVKSSGWGSQPNLQTHTEYLKYQSSHQVFAYWIYQIIIIISFLSTYFGKGNIWSLSVSRAHFETLAKSFKQSKTPEKRTYTTATAQSTSGTSGSEVLGTKKTCIQIAILLVVLCF